MSREVWLLYSLNVSVNLSETEGNFEINETSSARLMGFFGKKFDEGETIPNNNPF
jgi:hypothetical protein